MYVGVVRPVNNSTCEGPPFCAEGTALPISGGLNKLLYSSSIKLFEVLNLLLTIQFSTMFTNNLIRWFPFLTNSNTKSSALYHLIMRRYYRATLLSILQQFLLFFNTNNASRQYVCRFEQCNLSVPLFFTHTKSSLPNSLATWTE